MELAKKADSRELVGRPDGSMSGPGEQGPKTKTPRRWSGRSFLQVVAYRNRTWFVKREMQEKAKKGRAKARPYKAGRKRRQAAALQKPEKRPASESGPYRRS